MASGRFTSPAPIGAPAPPDHEDHLAIAHEYEELWDEEDEDDDDEDEG